MGQGSLDVIDKCDVTAVSHVLAMSHVTAVGAAIGTAIGAAIGAAIGNANGGWQSQVIWRSIYSPRSSRSQSDCFYPKRHYFT